MTILSVTDAARMAGVSRLAMVEKVEQDQIHCSVDGIEVDELIRVYPNLKPLAKLKIRAVKKAHIDEPETCSSTDAKNVSVKATIEKTQYQVGTVELLVRELEWNKELLEQTNQLMAKQLADQRALIADQARRLDEKDRFWGRQIEIAQSLLPAPTPVLLPRKKFLGIF